MHKSFLLASACLFLATGPANALVIPQQAESASVYHGGISHGTIYQWDSAAWGGASLFKVQIDVTGTALFGGPDTGLHTGATVDGYIAGFFTTDSGPYMSLGYVNYGEGTATCDSSGCVGEYSASFSRTFTGADLAIFNGSGSLSFYDNSYVNAGGPFYNTDSSVIVWFYTASAPEPATWAMMLGGFGLVGAAMRRRKTSVSFA